MRFLMLLAACIVAVTNVGADEIAHVLLPVTASAIPGANGSLWMSSVALTNYGSEAIQVYGWKTGEPCSIDLCLPPALLPGTTVYAASAGQFLSIHAIHPDEVDMVTVQLRVQDASRSLQTWGTSIPVVFERDTYVDETLSLTDIVQNDRFRSMLRIYDFALPETPASPEVELRIYAIEPGVDRSLVTADALLLTRRVSLTLAPSAPSGTPRMAQLPLWLEPELEGHELLRIEITSATPGLRFWAFTSITNNDTQHVTIVAPR